MQGINTLTEYAFHSPSETTSRNALRCLANAMLLKPLTRQAFVDLEFQSKACAKLNNESWDDELLISRIIFLTTYGTNIDLVDLVDKHNIAEVITQKLKRHAKIVTARSSSKSKNKACGDDPMQSMALAESLKLLFNISHFCPQRVSSFTPTIPHIVALLWKQDIDKTKPLDSPFSPLVNALLNLKLDDANVHLSLYPSAEPTSVSARLIEILESSVSAYGDHELETLVTPVVGVLRRLYDGAPENVKVFVREQLLPTDEDRKLVLGKGMTISAKLLRNSTNPMTPQLREAISQFLFEMSDRDATKFVENVGYGFASGFLFQNNIPIPHTAPGGASESNQGGRNAPVNIITGQRLDSEKHPGIPEMTQDEKEREAERLFVLFQR
jgi:hypothetical protein